MDLTKCLYKKNLKNHVEASVISYIFLTNGSFDVIFHILRQPMQTKMTKKCANILSIVKRNTDNT